MKAVANGVVDIHGNRQDQPPVLFLVFSPDDNKPKVDVATILLTGLVDLIIGLVLLLVDKLLT